MSPISLIVERSVPIARDVVRHLKAHQAATGQAIPDDLIFATEAGTPLDPHNVRARVLHPTAKRAGLIRPPRAGSEPVPWIGFHTFRHTCATRLFRQGRNAKQVQLWLGHHSPSFTLQTYVHLLGDDLGGPLDTPEVVEPDPGAAESFRRRSFGATEA